MKLFNNQIGLAPLIIVMLVTVGVAFIGGTYYFSNLYTSSPDEVMQQSSSAEDSPDSSSLQNTADSLDKPDNNSENLRGFPIHPNARF